MDQHLKQVPPASECLCMKLPLLRKSALSLAVLVTPVVSLSAAPTFQTAGWTSQSTIMVPEEPLAPVEFERRRLRSLKLLLGSGLLGQTTSSGQEVGGLISFSFFLLMTNAYLGTAVSFG